jgi:hypothetical protein
VIIAVDASSIKVAYRGEWMWLKRRRCRGFLKIRIALDVETKQIVAIEVTDERIGDSGIPEPLVEQVQRYCRVKVLRDGTYDSRTNFSYMAKRGIEPAIKGRRNSSSRARGSHERKQASVEQLQDLEA